MLKLVPRGWAAVATALILASIVLLALEQNLGAFATFGLGMVLLVGLAFFAVGRSEDIDREKHPRG
jgi:membrane-bound ClpP family serine protease